jgi:hypothetical protein
MGIVALYLWRHRINHPQYLDMSTQLTTVLSDAGLDQNSNAAILEKFAAFDAQASEWMAKAKTLVVTGADQKDEIKQAREARLALRKIRTEADKTRKELKAESLRYGKAVQGVYNFLEYKIKPIEDHLQSQEDFAKIAEQKRVDALRAERELLVNDLREFVGYGDDFGAMSQPSFDAVLASAKQQRADQIKHNEEAKAAHEAEVLRQAEDQRKMRAENERLRSEAQAREAALKVERDLVAAEQKAAADAARIEREAAAAKARAEREAAEIARRKIANELAAAKRAQAEQDAKVAALAKAKAEQERKANAAPDKAKLRAFLAGLSCGGDPSLNSVDATEILNDFRNDLAAIVSTAISRVEAL